MIQNVIGKLGPMRKKVEWVVYPNLRKNDDGDEVLFVQSDKRAVAINVKTGKGMLSNGKGHPGFHTVSKFLGAIEIDVPRDFINRCLAAMPKKGDSIGQSGGVIIG